MYDIKEISLRMDVLSTCIIIYHVAGCHYLEILGILSFSSATVLSHGSEIQQQQHYGWKMSSTAGINNVSTPSFYSFSSKQQKVFCIVMLFHVVANYL